MSNGSLAAAPAGAPAAAAPHNVPVALSSFVGRAAEREALAAALGTARLVTVTGPGGTGKTRLAREVAAACATGAAGGATGRDGVWWVELAPVDAGVGDPGIAETAVAAAVAAVLGVRLESGRVPAEALADAVGAQALLLVLDNCEHVVDAAAALAEGLLRACPRLVVLATSREALAVEGEAAWVLAPLARPPRPRPGAGAGPQTDAAAVGAYDAVRLFVERARAAQPTFALTDANAAAVAAICARLDGIPLALELAAAQVAPLGVAPLAARLDDALGVLTRGRRTAPARHQTLRALLDWSHARLGPDERRLLARLSVFRDAATLDAVAAVCAPRQPGGAAEASNVLTPLGRLVEQSLVDVRDAGGAVRYALLETVRQYAAERLAADPDAELVTRDRHLAWAAALVADADARLWSAAWTAEAARLAPVVDDLRAAVAWAASAADPSPAGRARAVDALRVVGPLMWYWVIVGGWDDATHVVGAALGAAAAAGLARRDGDPPRWDAAPNAPRAATRALGVALACWTVLLSLRNRHADALPAIAGAQVLWDAECAAVAEGRDPVALRWRSYTGVVAAEARLATGDAAAAVRLDDAAVADARASGDARAVAFALTRCAFVRAAVGDVAPATALLEEAAPLWEAQREQFFLTLTQQTLAELALAGGDAAAAARHARMSVAQQGDGYVPFLVARGLVLVAAAATAAGPAAAAETVAAAARLLGAADRLRTRSGMLLQHYDRPAQDRAAAAATARLGAAAFRAAWAEGERLAPPAAVELAMRLGPAAPDVGPAPDGAPNGKPNGMPNGVPNEVPHRASNSPSTAAIAPAGAAAGAPSPAPSSPRRPPARPPAAADPPAPSLRVRVLGPLVVELGGVPFGDAPACGKVAELLLYLALHPEGRTKEQIGLALWPDGSAAQVRSSFHFTLHHLRRALADPGRGGDAAAGERVPFADGRYRLAGASTDAGDVRAAAEALRRAEPVRLALDAATLAEAERALATPPGPLGEGVGAGAWLAECERTAADAWADGVQLLARQHARAGRQARAAELLEALVAREPLREGAHRELMALWAAGGDRARALAHYDALVGRLGREVGAAPARETRQVAEAIRGT